MQKNTLLLKLTLCLLLFLSAIESFFSIRNLYSLPGDTDNSVLLGLSLPRLIVFSFLFIALLLCLFTVLLILLKEHRWEQIYGFIFRYRKTLALITGMFAMLFGWFVFAPAYRFGHFSAYYERLKPILSWVFLFTFQLLLVLAVIHINQNLSPSDFKISKKNWKSFLFFSMLFVVLILVITITGWGISPIVRFWEKTGVPILSGQSYWGWVLGVFLIFLTPALFPKANDLTQKLNRQQWIIFFVIWIISAVLWMQEPIQFNHFNPGPYPPNFQHYPNSDAQYYDLSAQRALLGQEQFTLDKPLYSAMLLGYHLLAGQNSDLMIQIQTALFAVFPALLYLLGTRLHHPFSGLMAALFANFRVINSILAQTWIWKTSSPKLMMTEFPTAILLLLLTITLIGWFSSKKNRMIYAIASGGILALATLMRHNNWAFLPMIVVFSLMALWKHKEVWGKTILAFIIMVFLTSSPMMIYTQINDGVPFTFLIAMKGSINNSRFKIIRAVETSQPLETNANNDIEKMPIAEPTPAPVEDEPNVNLDSPFEPGRIFNTSVSPQPMSTLGQTDFFFINPLLDTMMRHMFHNLVSTGLSLPVSPTFDTLENLLRESPLRQLWDIEWDGSMPFISWIMLICDLLLVSIALAFSWRKWHWTGLTPLAILMTYYAGNAFATTSGGRYMIPVDWAFYFYYAMGVVIILMFASDRLFRKSTLNFSEYSTAEITPAQTRILSKNTLSLVGLFVGIVALVALGMNGFKPKFPDYTPEEILSNLVINQPEVDQTAIQPYVEAVQKGDLLVFHGSLLYPIYLNYLQDEDFEVETQSWDERKPALFFTVLSNDRDFIMGRLSMNSSPDELPDGAESIVFTCPNHEAYALLIFNGEHSTLLQQSDWKSIQCPK